MLTFRMAKREDVDLFFIWANDSLARTNSYQKKEISYTEHVHWFNKQILDINMYLYIFFNDSDIPVGQVRINRDNVNTAIISLMVDKDFRKRGYAKEMIVKASSDFLKANNGIQLLAYIFKTNIPSYQTFINAGYVFLKEEVVKNIPSYILYKS